MILVCSISSNVQHCMWNQWIVRHLQSVSASQPYLWVVYLALLHFCARLQHWIDHAWVKYLLTSISYNMTINSPWGDLYFCSSSLQQQSLFILPCLMFVDIAMCRVLILGKCECYYSSGLGTSDCLPAGIWPFICLFTSADSHLAKTTVADLLLA